MFGALCERGKERRTAYDLLAYGIATLYGMSSLPNIAREPGGRPYFPDYPDICFNVSHSKGCAVCALHDKAIGVDIETLRAAPKRLASKQDDRSFFLRWTAKEATLKREGKGIGYLLRDFEPNALCDTFEDFVPGCIVAVCPSEVTEIHFELVSPFLYREC